jgi:hypothetical protein
MDAFELLEREIAALEAELKPRKAALAQLRRLRNRPSNGGDPTTRFFNVRPLLAARQVLAERGKPIPLDELKQILIDGGIMVGKKRGIHNINKSIEISVGINELTDSGTHHLIGLPEWKKPKS